MFIHNVVLWAVPSVFQKFMLLFPKNRKQEFLRAPVTDNFIGGYMTEDKEILQWHPAFFAGIQIELAQRMLQEYERNRENILYSSVMDIVVKANKDAFMKEGSAMCEELDKIINAKLDAREERGRNEGRSEGENDSKRRTARNLIKMGMSIEQIAEAVEEDISVVKEWIA